MELVIDISKSIYANLQKIQNGSIAAKRILQCVRDGKKVEEEAEKMKQEPKYCDRNICLSNEYNGIGCDECEVTKSQKPCDDCVSRQAAIEMAYDMSEIDGEHFTEPCMVVNVEDIQKLPFVTLQPKIGQWIYDKTIENWRCSECNETPKTMGYCGSANFMTEHFKYCNHCGAKMQ